MLMQDRWLLPEGIEEVFPGEAERLERLRGRVLNLFSAWGYQLVIPPLIEFFDSLLVGAGQDLDLQTFKLIDQISGRLMGIRADMTPQVARIDVRTAKNDLPSRLCYVGTVLHAQSDHLEKSRSPMQVGAELYGHAGHASDLEIIRLMLDMLAVAGLLDIHLDLGHVGIYRGLARQAGLGPEQEADLFQILQRKDRSGVVAFLRQARIAPPMAAMLESLLDLNGPLSILATARDRLIGGGEDIFRALADLEAIAGRLESLFPALPVNFDLAELRGYHYQTGVVFAAFVPGYGREIARGGRYDEIGKVFGHARPATGFSADLKVLLRLSSGGDEVPVNGRIFAPAVEDPDLYATVRSLRSQEYVVIEQLPGQAGNAEEMGCAFQLRKQERQWQVVRLGA
jgi:ATP phosphoribosyltransferase regulatory subunit